ncbi:hypothetical protein PU02_1317 [Bartonella ancashensis]|uniref:Uncharacterized protein n=1 Tax=Bartonella ancashensis TaxID=1318743 RepID=A0A0M3T379_9HYPH|nr:hypothetical protein PU02_1317 [Bartonella ancashensis]
MFCLAASYFDIEHVHKDEEEKSIKYLVQQVEQGLEDYRALDFSFLRSRRIS